MKSSSLVLTIGLALGGAVLAQDASVRGGAHGRSAASASASGNDARASASHTSEVNAVATPEQAGAHVADRTEMNATLSKPIDARRAKEGDEVTATLAQDASGNAAAPLPRGTKLIGRVTEAQPRRARADGTSDSRLGIMFFKAVRPDGSEIPVAATLQAVAAAEAAATAAQYEAGGGFASHGAGTVGTATTGGGVVGRAAGTAGATLGGVTNAGAHFGRTATASAGSATAVSAAAVGGIGASGQLLSGSRGVFGMRGVEIAEGSAGSVQGSVLTSQTGNVQLGRGTRMLLVSQAAAEEGR